jgi:hypothetical protein
LEQEDLGRLFWEDTIATVSALLKLPNGVTLEYDEISGTKREEAGKASTGRIQPP